VDGVPVWRRDHVRAVAVEMACRRRYVVACTGYLGHRRISQDSNQPMLTSNEKSWLADEGEIRENDA